MLAVKNVTVEYLANPIGIPLHSIRFGWTVETDQRGEQQAAYRIIVKNNEKTVWDSGKVVSGDTSGISYCGEALQPRTQYCWQVQVYTESGQHSEFSAPQSFEPTLSDKEWHFASFIGANTQGLPMLRKSFTLCEKTVAKARIYVCGLGNYQLSVNGNVVNCATITPLITRYHQRYTYNVYDVTSLLTNKENVFGILLGNGYYSMHGNGVNWQTENWANAPWTDRPKCKLLAFITYTDGTETIVATDETWKCAESALRVDEAYYGEEQDARLLPLGWDTALFDDSHWQNAVLVAPPLGKPEPQLAEGCSIAERIPLTLLYQKENEYLFEAQKMVVGWVKLTVLGNCGDEIEISYSEWKNEQGALDQKGLLSVWNFAGRMREPQTDYFILSGTGVESFTPYFVYKGFRYIRIKTKGKVKIQNAVAESVYANLAQTGHFSCSNSFINQLHEACKYTLLNNLHGFPSDTPVYEKLGYLADGYLTQEMAHYNFDAVKYYEKWARDILDQAKDNGYIEQTAPMWDEDKENAPEWSVAVAVVPYQLYKMTNDKTLLVEAYTKAKSVFAYQMRLTDGKIATSMWGDHAATNQNTIKEISATASLYNMANILAIAAKLQGKTNEEEEFSRKAEEIKSAFNKAFFNEDVGYYCERGKKNFALNAQVIPCALGLADETQKQKLRTAISQYAAAMDGGIFGIKYLFPILTDMGFADRLYAWVSERNAPSWGYWLSFGEGTLWEQWYDFTRSKNHHMFGTIDEWLYKTLGGLEVIDGKTISVSPYFAPQLQWAKASVLTINGNASSQWEKQNNAVRLSVEIPFNTTAKVYLPSPNVLESGKPLKASQGIRIIAQSAKETLLEIGSGKYQFEIIDN